jgi:hypothetical protein
MDALHNNQNNKKLTLFIHLFEEKLFIRKIRGFKSNFIKLFFKSIIIYSKLKSFEKLFDK